MTRLVIAEARRRTVYSIETQKSFRGLADRFLRLRLRRHKGILPRVESQVHVRIVEHVVLPHG